MNISLSAEIMIKKDGKKKTKRNFHVLLDCTTTLTSACINKYFNLSHNIVNANDRLLRLTPMSSNVYYFVVHYAKYNSVAI